MFPAQLSKTLKLTSALIPVVIYATRLYRSQRWSRCQSEAANVKVCRTPALRKGRGDARRAGVLQTSGEETAEQSDAGRRD